MGTCDETMGRRLRSRVNGGTARRDEAKECGLQFGAELALYVALNGRKGRLITDSIGLLILTPC